MHKACLKILKELESEGCNIWWDFNFPEPQPLTTRLKDYLDDEVDEKYYLSDEKVEQLLINIGGEPDLKKQVVGTCHPHNDLSRSTRERVYSSHMLSQQSQRLLTKIPSK